MQNFQGGGHPHFQNSCRVVSKFGPKCLKIKRYVLEIFGFLPNAKKCTPPKIFGNIAHFKSTNEATNPLNTFKKKCCKTQKVFFILKLYFANTGGKDI